MTEAERAYLAGFLDGDGCIHISCGNVTNSHVPYHRLNVIFSQADKPFLDKWRDKAGMGRVYLVREVGAEDSKGIVTRKTLYSWCLTTREAETMLRWLLPYLDIKKEQAEIALLYRKTKGRQGGQGRRAAPSAVIELRECYRQQLAALKHDDAGDVVTSSAETLERLYSSQIALPGIEN